MYLAGISVLPIAFLLSFALLWFGVTTLFGFLSGWYSLMRRYPDRPEAALLTLKSQSGSLGAVGIRGALRLSVCASGLRIGLMRLLGPFCRDFLVPWQSISVTRKDRVLWRAAILDFAPGRLRLPSEVADRLARVAGAYWPEPGPFPAEADGAVRWRLLKQWLVVTTFAAGFFILVPLIAVPARARPPIAVAILFPAVVCGAVSFVQYLRRRKD